MASSYVDISYVRGEKTREIPDYEGLYGVSNFGNVYNLRTKCGVNPLRESYVVLSKDSKAKTWRIGDLVARTWIRNVGGLAYVRHKDGDVRNNRVDNLEWCAEKERVRMGRNGELKRRVLQLTLMGDLVRKYGSVSDASYASGVDKGSISRCCRGSAVSAGGYRWRFESSAKK